MSHTTNSTNSTPSRSDPDWSQVKETVLMLKLAAAQVDFSLKDGANSVDTLASSFTGMASNIKDIEISTAKLYETYQVSEEDKTVIEENCNQIANTMQQAIVAFQFYDTLAQRMDHVVNCLSQMGDLVSDPKRLYSPDEWSKLQDSIRKRYTMEKERELFDAILNGEDMVEVLQRMHEVSTSDDGIELF